MDFLYTPEAQTIFGQKGFRPEVDEVAAQFPDFPQPANLATVDEDLGGWAEARPKFFDPETGIMAEIFRELGRDATIDSGTGARPSRRPGASGAYDGRGLLGPGIAALYLGLIVLIPIAALLWQSRRRTAWMSSRRPSRVPQALAAIQVTFAMSVSRRAHQRRHRHAHRVGPRARRLPGQARRQRAHRPALRAAHHRGRA